LPSARWINSPRADYYVYRFHDVDGWQLDKNFGPVEGGDNPDEALKLVANAKRPHLYRRELERPDHDNRFDDPPPRSKAVILSCRKLIDGSSAKFGRSNWQQRPSLVSWDSTWHASCLQRGSVQGRYLSRTEGAFDDFATKRLIPVDPIIGTGDRWGGWGSPPVQR